MKKRRIISLLLSIVMVVTVFPAAFCGGERPLVR